MSAVAVWRSVSLGVFLLAVAAIVHYEAVTWHWIFVVMAAMSFVNALLKARWRWAPHPLMWAAGLAYSYASKEGAPGHVAGWTMFLALCGASIILSYLVSLVPHRRRRREPLAPARPGEGVVIDVDVRRRGTND